MEGKQGIPVTKTEICASEEYVEKRDEVDVGGELRKLKKHSEEEEHQLQEQV